LLMPSAGRALAVLLDEHGSLCERCLAHRARATLSEVASMLERLRQVITVGVEHAECPECRQFARTFFLARKRHRPTRNAPP
jgi:hypothetical protein